jgi:hypothetical protein
MSDTTAGLLQIALLLAALAACYRPLGAFMARVYTSEHDSRVERVLYRIMGVDPKADQRWPVYARSLIAFSASKVLIADINTRRAAAAKLDGVNPAQVAADALLASGSGLDPDISPAYAAEQVPRVARVRGLSQPQVRALVAEYTKGRTLGFLGEPRANVLELNLALDAAGH